MGFIQVSMHLKRLRISTSRFAVPLHGAVAIKVFLSFASAYFISYAFRSINAVIAPELIRDLQINNAQLGLLSSAYFIGFGAAQIPLGIALDRFGPKLTEMFLMLLAVLGAMVFAYAENFYSLVIGRMLIGMGVSACLMAAFSGFRAWFGIEKQSQLASAMLVFGTSGALMTTWPVHIVLPHIGWRGIFIGMALLALLAILGLYFGLPNRQDIDSENQIPVGVESSNPTLSWESYRPILTSPYFWRIFPIGAVSYGGFIAIQTLWLGPWLIQVMEFSSAVSAQILFGFNAVLLAAYFVNTLVLPMLVRRGIGALNYLTWMSGAAICFQFFAFYWRTPWVWVWWCLIAIASASYVLAQSLIVTYFATSLAGRVSTTYNLALFIGAFILQWGIGYLVEVGVQLGWSKASAFDLAFGIFLAVQVIGYLWFLISPNYFSAKTNFEG